MIIMTKIGLSYSEVEVSGRGSLGETCARAASERCAYTVTAGRVLNN
jgi:hypothetical protein